MKRTNYYFPDDLIARVKAHAEARQTTASDVIRRAIEEYLQRSDTPSSSVITVQVINQAPGARVQVRKDSTGHPTIFIKESKK